MDLSPVAFFLQGAALGISAAATPGPLQTLLISETLLGGFRRGARVTLAPLITDAPIILLVLFVLRRVPPLVMQILSLAGGLFVLYLAWSLWQQWRVGAAQDVSVKNAQPAGWQGLRRAVIMNWLSPNPYVFWVLVNGPILIAALSESVLHGAAFLLGFYGIFLGAMLVIAALFHQARRFGPRIVRGLLFVSIIILAVFGALLIRQGFISVG